MRRKRPEVEVLAPLLKPSVPAAVGAALERLVEAKITEILSVRDSALLEPWFRTKREAYEIRRRQTVHEQRKFSRVFDKYGCYFRGHKGKPHSRPHAGQGLCDRCKAILLKRLKEAIVELEQERQEGRG